MKQSKPKITPRVLFTYRRTPGTQMAGRSETEPTTMTITITTSTTGMFKNGR